MAATAAIAQAIGAVFNTVSNAINAQAAIIAGQLSVNQQATAYHAMVDKGLIDLSTGRQSQETIIVAVVLIALVVFFIIVLTRT